MRTKGFKTTTKKYYKRGSAWSQPVLTSNTSSSVMTVSATDAGQQPAYKAFDNGSGNGSYWCTTDGVTSGTLTANFNQKLFITSVQITGLSTQYGYTKTIQILSDGRVIGEAKTFNTGASQTTATNTWEFSTPIRTGKLSFYGVGVGWVAISNIKITAYTVVDATENDYDDYENISNYKLVGEQQGKFKAIRSY